VSKYFGRQYSAVLGESWLRRRFCRLKFSALARRFGFLVARRFGSSAGFGLLRLIGFGSGAAFRLARQAAGKTSQQQHNKALHPTAYSLRFGRKLPSLRLPAAGELSRYLAAHGLNGYDTFYGIKTG
jgi:hypothetical protein